MESARNEKIIGHSLNAKVEISAEGELYKFFKENEDELKTVFITSDAVVLEGKSDGAKGDETGAYIKISVSEGEKCERCWMYSKTVGEDKEHPTLCKRCADVVKSL